MAVLLASDLTSNLDARQVQYVDGVFTVTGVEHSLECANVDRW